MSDPAVKKALDLIDRAWRARYRAFQQRPDSEEDLQRVIASVHADLEKAVAICRDVGAKRELSMALGKLGHVVEDAEAKLACYVEAVAAARECGDAMQLAHAVRHLGDVHRSAGRRAEAKGCYDEALNLYRSEAAAPTLDVANALRPMAILKADLGERQEALALWRKAKELYATVDIAEGVEEADRWIERLT
ncbi:MAG: tetratricopeptide repeat protein [Gammaproteobacteria bacterium]|nr:tetratricopeptide repeat protein [Gammaproteobacteria bacterium]MDE0659237.1 tetratricopeptide repeat protein [Gammaproteobacteria bacterium]